MKQRRKLFTESPEEKSQRRTAVGVLGGIATATGAGVGYLSSAKKEKKELGKYAKENESYSSAIKDMKSSRENYLKSERSKRHEALNKSLQEIDDKYLKKSLEIDENQTLKGDQKKSQKDIEKKKSELSKRKARESGQKKIEKEMKTLEKEAIKKDVSRGRKYTSKIKENKGKIEELSKKISKKSRRNALIGAGIGITSSIAANEYLKRRD